MVTLLRLAIACFLLINGIFLSEKTKKYLKEDYFPLLNKQLKLANSQFKCFIQRNSLHFRRLKENPLITSYNSTESFNSAEEILYRVARLEPPTIQAHIVLISHPTHVENFVEANEHEHIPEEEEIIHRQTNNKEEDLETNGLLNLKEEALLQQLKQQRLKRRKKLANPFYT